MSYERKVMGAMLRLARKRMPATTSEILVRAGGTDANLRTALRKLEQEGAVERQTEDVSRLTMMGLALAVACTPARTTVKKPRASAKISPKKAVIRAA